MTQLYVPAPPPPHSVGPPPQSPVELDSESNTIADLIGTLVDSKWLVCAVTLAMLGLGLAYSTLAQPVYRTDVLVQVEEKGSGLNAFTDVSSMLGGETPAETEIEILRSRSSLLPVIEQLSLDIDVQPGTFPWVGAGMSRRYRGAGPAPARWGMSSYAWGGEKASIKRLVVPEELEDKELQLRVLGGSKYELSLGEECLARGQVGQPAAALVPGVELFVNELVAREGTSFSVMKLSSAKSLERLSSALSIFEKGKKTGIISLSIDGSDPKKMAATLDALATVYLRQNVERKSEEAKKTLDFLNTQLPELKANLHAAEAALNAHRSKHGTVDLGMEAQVMLDRAVEVEKQITALSLERAELQQRFTESHPAMATLRHKLERLQAERASVNGNIKRLPESELESARLMRDVKVSNELYLVLLNKAQELKVVKSGTVGNVRILDQALVPREPIRPKRAITVLASLMLGVLLSVGLALGLRALDRGVSDPDQFERVLGLTAYATVPHSNFQKRLMGFLRRGGPEQSKVLVKADPSDRAVESLRSLRTSLQFALSDAKNNVISISGPRPGVGKSFVSTNLAFIMADTGRRVLLIDADMRRGTLHQYFSMERARGLSELLTGQIQVADAVRSLPGDSVSVITTGIIPPKPAELLMGERFRTLLAQFSNDYDYVIVDTPPILAVTDSAIVGRSAGVNLLVLKAGLHPMREIALALKRLQQNGVRPQGMVYNDVPTQSGGSFGRHSYHYQYDYR